MEEQSANPIQVKKYKLTAAALKQAREKIDKEIPEEHREAYWHFVLLYMAHEPGAYKDYTEGIRNSVEAGRFLREKGFLPEEF